MYHGPRPTLANGHFQRRHDQLCPQVRGECPSRHPSTPGIHDHGDVQEARPSRHVGDVGHPEPIWTLGAKVALDQIGSESLRPVCVPSDANSAWIRGVPLVPRGYR